MKRSVSRRQFLTGVALTAVAVPAGVVLGRSTLSGTERADTTSTSGTPSGVQAQTNATVGALPGWYVPTDWGRHWRTKLAAAKAGKGSAVVAIAGDSVGFGYWASDMLTTSWAGRVGTALAAVGGDGGSGFVGQAHSESVLFNPGSLVSQSYRSVPGNVWAQSGEWQAVVPPYMFGPGIGAVMATSNGVRLSGRFRGSQLVVWYYNGGAPFTVLINGQIVRSVQVGSSWEPTALVLDVPGGDPGEHDWSVIGGFDAGSKFGTGICGIEGRRPGGVRLNNHSFPGLYTSVLANHDTPYQTGTFVGGWRNPADLIIYEAGGNDLAGRDPKYPNGTPPQVWGANIRGFLDGLQAPGASSGRPDVLFLTPPFNLLGDTHNLLPEYRKQMLALSQSHNAAWFDGTTLVADGWETWVRNGMAGNATTPGATGDDGAHPSDKGHALIAERITPLLTALS